MDNEEFEEFADDLWEYSGIEDVDTAYDFVYRSLHFHELLKLSEGVRDTWNLNMARIRVATLYIALTPECAETLTLDHFDYIYPTLGAMTLDLSSDRLADPTYRDSIAVTLIGTLLFHLSPKDPYSQLTSMIERHRLDPKFEEWFNDKFTVEGPTLH